MSSCRFHNGIIVLAILAGFSASAPAQEAARITRVTLYPGSAAVERVARVDPGAGTLQMSGLPANFDVRTLRVEADAGIRIGEVSVQEVGRAQALGGREAGLEAKIQGLKDEKAALDVEVKTAELVRDYLSSLTRQPARDSDKTTPALDPKFIPAVIEAIRRGGADAYGQIQKIEIKKRALDKEIAALERDLARLRGGGRDARTVSIGYSAARGGELRASYQVANAGWKPAYRASLDSSTSRVELERQAAIFQRTGEDWRGVSVRLSTGQPRPAQLPDPSPWQIDLRPQPIPYSAANAPMARLESQSSKALADEARPSVAQVETQFATEFEVPGNVDLPADGRQVNVSLSRETLPVRQRVRIIPRRDSVAMVTAEAELPEGVWIPGDAQLYRDGSYIGSTFWNAQAKEKLMLPFGRDDRLQVSVNRTKNRSGSAGLLGGRAERQVADLYTITSRHKVPVELLVLEATPVAVSDQIKIDAQFAPQPKIRDWEDKRGVVAWQQPLAPGETLKLVADYTITYPKDAPIVGLP